MVLNEVTVLLPGVLMGLIFGLPLAVRFARYEAAKRLASEKFDRVFKRSPTPFFEVSMDAARVMKQNPSSLIRFGDVKGMTVPEFTVLHDLKIDMEELALLREKKRTHYYVLKRWNPGNRLLGGVLSVTIFYDDEHASMASWAWSRLLRRQPQPVCVAQVVRLPLNLPPGYHWGQVLDFRQVLCLLDLVRERAEAYGELSKLTKSKVNP